MLLFHIAIALTSLLATTYVYVRPSQTGLRVSYSLAGLTLASGTVLVLTAQTSILHTCLAGLLYFGGVAYGLTVAHHKLTYARQRSK